MSTPVGISNHPASQEAAEDANLPQDQGKQQGDDHAQTEQKTSIDAEKGLPGGMAEKVETVETSTMTPHK